MGKQKINIQDLEHLKIINDPQISPDGSRVVFSVQKITLEKNRYDSHLFLVDIPTAKVTQFTYGEVFDWQPRWSPDGNSIAFCRNKDVDSQIWIISAKGGEAHPLTKLDEGKLGTFQWSPDGLHLVFEFRLTHPDWTGEAHANRKKKNLSNPPRVHEKLHYRSNGLGFIDLSQQIWIYNIKNRKVRAVTDGEWDSREPIWSPGGDSIVIISNRCDDPDSRPYEEDIWILPLDGGSLKKIPTFFGYKKSLSWSPNGDYLAFIGSETKADPWCARNDGIWIVPLLGGSASNLISGLDRATENVSISDLMNSGNQNPIWKPDSSGLYFIISDQGNGHIYQVNLDGKPKPFINGDMVISGFGIDSPGKRMVILSSAPVQPAELFIKNINSSLDEKNLLPITNVNKSFLVEIQVSQPDEIWYRSSDGTKIQGWLLKPPDFDPKLCYPLVLYIHGGPAAQYGNTYFHEFQVLAARGYLVLYTNPRGSLGREYDFVKCIEGDWGNLDYQDLIAAVDYILDRPFVDGSRLAVIGGSYGGFMVNWIIGHTDKFRCAISERGVSNRHSAFGTSDQPPMPDGYWPGNNWDRPERLLEQSPLRLAGSIQTPLLIIHSQGDLRCPIEQAEQIFSALRRLNREVTFIRYPLETSHGLSRSGPPDLRIDRLQRITGWLDKYLK
jgi:dipeptidyl aminopeptidase/acylaminoacyl peptidase